MTRRRSWFAAGATAFALLVPFAACSDDSGGDAVSSTGQVDETATGEESNGPADDDSDGELGPAGGVAYVEVQGADATVAVSPAGFDPAETTIAVGDVVKFTAGDGGIYGVVVGDLDGYTVTSGLDAFFEFDLPGTFVVGEDISGATASVVVE
ncbi:hypothetical protein [Nocardioides sp. R-C-SC26]|uniref:cupredoxin domain-containing protein n=1 Tax=Nocardioides sp. R-C-SC26 TaxID=2870414 RepID=UPI001E3592EC|nr:hypothetical protein [Nocardioides sp. R-C-SC26]